MNRCSLLTHYALLLWFPFFFLKNIFLNSQPQIGQMRLWFVWINPFLQSQWGATKSFTTINVGLFCHQLLIELISPQKCLWQGCRALAEQREVWDAAWRKVTWNYLTKGCDQRQQFLQKGARSSAEGSPHGLSGGGAPQGMVPAAARALARLLGTDEAPHGRHSPTGVPGLSLELDGRWAYIACRSCVLLESLSSRQEKSCGSRSADPGVAEVTERRCPDLLQGFAGTRAQTFSCSEGDTGIVWACLVGKQRLSQWPRLEASVLSTMTLGLKQTEETGWQSTGSHSWEAISLLSSGEKHLYTPSHTGFPSTKEMWQTGVSATQAYDDH